MNFKLFWPLLPLRFFKIFFNLLLFRYAEYLRLNKAAIVCQKQYRMVRDRRAYLRVRQAVITIQAYTRGMYTRRIYMEVHKE